MARAVDIAIIGAGPYGLSLAAHLRSSNIEFRIFGEPMESWKHKMPAGMLLKSYPWATNLSEPSSQFTIKQFCADRSLFYHGSLMPLPLERFIEYGHAFQERFAPDVERKRLTSLVTSASGFEARFDDGDIVFARSVVLAIGLGSFAHVPAIAHDLPREFVSHSADYGALDALDGKEVAVVGAGSSATDLSALLHERGISVSLVSRAPELNFAGTPRPHGLLQRAVAPTSGIGNGWTMGTCATAPQVIHRLPANIRVRLANAPALGPLGGAFMRDRVIGRVPLRLGRDVTGIQVSGHKVDLQLAIGGNSVETLHADHVVFATGYRTNLERLGFLAPEILDKLRKVGRAPQLSRHYEASVPGLHFIGPAAANSFGPVCRFVYGTYHPARHLASYFHSVLSRGQVSVPVRQPIESPVLQ